MSDATCTQCGESDWEDDKSFGGVVCGNCGWRPRHARQEEIRNQ